MLSSKEYDQIKTSLNLIADDNGNVPLDKCVKLLTQWVSTSTSWPGSMAYPPGVRGGVTSAVAAPQDGSMNVDDVMLIISNVYDELSVVGPCNKNKLLKVVTSKIGNKFNRALLEKLIDDKFN